MTDGDERWWSEIGAIPTEPERVPIANSWLFLLGFGVYSGLVMWSALSVGRSTHGSLVTEGAVPAGVSLFVLAVLVQWRQSGRDPDSIPWPVVVGCVLSLLVYVGEYVVFASVLAGRGTGRFWPLVLVACAQSGILAMMLGVYSRPLVPRGGHTRRGRERYEHHLTNWWRFAQLTMSVFVAYGIGLAAGVLKIGESPPGSLAKLAVVAGGGILALAVYAFLKLYFVGERIEDAA